MTPKEESYKGTVSIQLLQAKTKIHTRIHNGMPEITVSVKAAAKITANDTPMDFSKTPHLKAAEKKFSDDLQQSITTMISRTQKKYKSDIIGFGRDLHIEHPSYWKTAKAGWLDLYPKVPVSVRAELTIERIGRTQANPYTQLK
jgi:spore germination protein KC